MKRQLIVAVIAATAGGAAAQPFQDPAASVANFDKAPWNEEKIRLPGWPQPENLIRFDAGPARAFDFFVDGASVSVGADGVIRFTVVAKSDHATNVSYEGLRCATAERKVYAYGREDTSWYEPRNPAWAKIGNEVVEGHRYALYQDYFCPARSSIRSAAEGIAALKRGGHPRASDLNTGDLLPR